MIKYENYLNSWTFNTSGTDINVSLFGVNIFNYKWEKIAIVNVIDPLYGYKRNISVYKTTINDKIYEFAAGEFSNGVWVFFTKN